MGNSIVEPGNAPEQEVTLYDPALRNQDWGLPCKSQAHSVPLPITKLELPGRWQLDARVPLPSTVLLL